MRHLYAAQFVAGRGCVLRQARDEEDRGWHRLNAMKKEPHPELVEGRTTSMQPGCSVRTRTLRFFIVHAHHEPTSFNGAMTREAVAALQAAGHEVVVSDLYAMGFDPVSDRRNFVTVANPERLRQQSEEAYASEHDGF